MLFGKDNNFNAGVNFMKEENYSSAIDCFQKTLEKDPKHQESLYNLSKAYFKSGQLSLAKETLISLVKLHPAPDLIVQILEITNWKKLVSDKFFNSHFSFSPDGQKIVFVSVRRDTNGDGALNIFDRGGVYLLDVETGESKMLVPDDYYNAFPNFSPDGKKIVFVSARRDANGDGIIDFQDNGSLYLLDLETGQETLILGDEYRPKFPSIFPDNKKVVCCGWDKGQKNCSVLLIDLGDNKIRRLTNPAFENTFPVISPDGAKIVYPSWREDTNGDGIINIRDNSSIYVYDLISAKEEEIVSADYDSSYPQWLPNVEGIVYLSRRRDTNRDGKINSLDNSGVYLFNLKKKKEMLLISDNYFNKFPTVLGDGQYLVYIGSWRNPKKPTEKNYFENKGLYCLNLINKEEKQIVSDRYYGCRFPVALPVEHKVAYLSWRKGTNRGIYLATLDRLPTEAELLSIIEENL